MSSAPILQRIPGICTPLIACLPYRAPAIWLQRSRDSRHHDSYLRQAARYNLARVTAQEENFPP
jgi:hypothetical protein